MILLDAIKKLAELDEASTIYLRKPWTAGSIAIVAPEADGGGVPSEAKSLGLSYFIEVSIARDFLQDWAAALPAAPTLDEQCERLIQYAINDA